MPTTDIPLDANAELRRSIYLLLIVVGIGILLGRIFAVDAVDRTAVQEYRFKTLPSDLQAKQRELESQGLTGEALQKEMARVENAWRQQATLRRPFLSANDRSRWCAVRALVEPEMRVPGFPFAIDRVIQEPNWDTIDMVQHNGHLYSSKPPLLTVAMAAVYWPIYHLTGATLGTHPFEIGRAMLVLFNIIPLTIYFLLLARWIERLGTTDWGRLFAIAAAVFGTFLTTFAITINNHLIAAACAMLAVDAALRIGFDGQRRARDFILAGLFGSLMVFNEFPAASLWALLALLLLWLAPRQTLIAFLPAAILVAIAAFGANWIAFGSFEPAYAHRDSHDTWYNYTYEVRGRTIESYWNNPVGFDRGEPSRGLYMLNVLVGHHGVFSLTPVWLLSFLGLGLWLWRPHDPRLRWMSAIILLSSLVCLAFYISLPPILRNYGGRTSGLRWMFWLAPLWLLAMLPALDTLAQRRWTRGLALVLLLLSALSAAYPIWNPWTDPWLMDAVRWWGRGA